MKLATSVLLNNKKRKVNELFAALNCMTLLTLDLMVCSFVCLFSNRDVTHRDVALNSEG